MNTRSLVTAVVQRLRAAFPGWTVERFPDDPEVYPFKDRGRAILVSYVRSTYGEIESFNPWSTTRTIELAVTVLSRSLVANDGAIETVDNVRRALFGWEPELTVTTPASDPGDPPVVTKVSLGCTPLTISSEGDVTHKGDAIWWFALGASTTATEVAQEILEPVISPGIDDVELDLEA